MMRLLAVFVGLAAALSLSASGLAIAGGWAVVKLDGLPVDVAAGKSISIGFTVLQHGASPVSGIKPIVHAGHATSGEKFEVVALDQGEPGHYVADLTFSSSGTWNWSIDAFGADHVMPPLEVLAPVTAESLEANGGGTIAVEGADGANVISESLAGPASIFEQSTSNDLSSSNDKTAAIDNSASIGETSAVDASASMDEPAVTAKSATVADGTPVQRRLALGLGAAGIAMLSVAGVLGARVVRRDPVPARG